MANTFSLEENSVSRVEGHGDLVLDVKNKKIEKLLFRIPESPRFFEAMLVGRNYDEPSHITSRICGICSVAHTLASIKATEKALGIEVSEQTLKLRKLIMHHECVQSNVLHVYFLAAPDLFGVGSVVPLVDINPEVVNIALRTKAMANEMVRIIGGRAVHPIRTVVGGFTKLPTIEEMEKMKKILKGSYRDLEKSLEVFKTLKLPEFERETEYISITDPDEYALYDGNIKSSDGWEIDDQDYLDKIREKVVQYSTGKHARASRDSQYAEELGLRAPCYNTFMNNMAQFVEVIHSIDDSIRLIDEMLESGLNESYAIADIKVRPGRGVGVDEAPRGLLIHDYTYDEEGKIAKANLIIPTNQNYANLEKDMQAMVPDIIDKTEAEIKLACEMMIRAYDPCISCSTHFLNVTLKNK